MQVKLAREMGFCFGVRRAVGLVEKLVADGGGVVVLGELVHNPRVVASLRAKGVRTAASVDDVPQGTVVIPSHGAPPGVFEEAQRKGLDVVDATCPFVRLAQKAAQELMDRGFQVIVVGDPAHTEVIGIVGWAGGRAHVVSGPDDLASLSLASRVGVLAQTTQPLSNLRTVANRMLSESLGELKELRVVNTICSATAARQAAASELAQQADLVVVVGGKTSANTRRLVEICRRAGGETHQVEGAGDVRREWLLGRDVVGVTAGASTPDEVISEVVEAILAIGNS